MARQLPRLIDEYFLDLQAAFHGSYVPRALPTTPQNARDMAMRQMDSFSRRADLAMQHYQQNKG